MIPGMPMNVYNTPIFSSKGVAPHVCKGHKPANSSGHVRNIVAFMQCSTITFEILVGGFEHGLICEQTIESSKKCKSCYLMVCSFCRLQVLADTRQVKKGYESCIPGLKEIKAFLDTWSHLEQSITQSHHS
jgi:hypothetical protein